MEVLNKFRMIRAELKEKLRDKVLMTDEQLDGKDENDELDDLFYSLPQTPYTDHNGFTMSTYIVALEGNLFKLYDNETGERHYLEVEWMTTDAIAEFLEHEPAMV
jgi:hypothetical protein